MEVPEDRCELIIASLVRAEGLYTEGISGKGYRKNLKGIRVQNTNRVET